MSFVSDHGFGAVVVVVAAVAVATRGVISCPCKSFFLIRVLYFSHSELNFSFSD